MSYYVLTDTERTLLIQFIAEYTTDEMLLAAVEDIQRQKEALSAQLKGVRAGLPAKMTKTPADQFTAAQVSAALELQTPPLVLNKIEHSEPPGEASSRVTGASKELINRRLLQGEATIAEINTFIKGKLSNTQSILKLLWQRQEIQWTGTKYKKL